MRVSSRPCMHARVGVELPYTTRKIQLGWRLGQCLGLLSHRQYEKNYAFFNIEAYERVKVETLNTSRGLKLRSICLLEQSCSPSEPHKRLSCLFSVWFFFFASCQIAIGLCIKAISSHFVKNNRCFRLLEPNF